MSTIPIMRPKLPSTERVAPYLRSIDASRIYTNFGPLALSLEERLAARFGSTDGTVTTVANATIGLALALTAQGAQRGTLCVIPAWTFIASAHAAMLAGLIPYFVDVDPSSWALDADGMDETVSRAPGAVGAIMPVAPFGQPIDVAAWDRFRSRSGLPVVIDAAAGFDSVTPGVTPAVVSLHATKVFGVGEGGFVLSTDTSLISDIRIRSNFGFYGTRDAVAMGANAKLSEYHAAVGLAALDEWPDVRGEWIAVAREYQKALPESNRLRFQDGFGKSWIASTCIVSLAGSRATRIASAAAEIGIGTHRWWGDGAHVHRATAAFPRASTPATEALARSTIALPFFRDLAAADIHRVADCVVAADAQSTARDEFGESGFGHHPTTRAISKQANSTDHTAMAAENPLHQIISEVLQIPSDRITPDIAIHKVDTWNSLTHLELVLTIEEKFHIQLSDDEIVAMTNIGEIERILGIRGALAE